MEPENPRSGTDDDDDNEGTTTDQIKLKAQEIAKRLEKYQGRYQTSSRCTTPLPITSADSVESIHSTSVISDTNEKLLLFRQFLENDRKLVEDSKIDERKYSNDSSHADGNELLLQNEEGKENLTYYENIIEAQYNEKSIQSLKNQIDELNEKLKNCHNVINEKDILLQTKIDEIESLSKTISQKNKLHLETVDALKQRNIEIINDERLRFSLKINQVVEETEELKHNLDYLDKKYGELRKNNIKIDKENNELRKKESSLKSEIEQLSINYKNEKKLLLQQNLKQKELSKKNVEDMEKELHHLQQENDLLKDHVSSLESRPINIQEKDDLLTKLSNTEKELNNLQQENYLLKDHVSLLESKSISTQENDDVLIKLNSMEKEINYLRQENYSLKDNVTSLESKLIFNTLENDDSLTKLQQENDGILSKLHNMEEELNVLKQENYLLKDHVSSLESKSINTLENDDLLTKLNNTEKELHHLQQENDELKNHVSLIESKSINTQENNGLLTKVHNMEEELNYLRQENYLLKDHVSSLESRSINTVENDDLLTKLNNTEKELHHLQQENDELKNHVSLIESKSINTQENDGLLTKVHSMEEELNYLRQENYLLKDHFSSLESKSINTLENDDLVTKLNGTEKELHRLQQENDKLKDHILSLESQFVNKQKYDDLLTKHHNLENAIQCLQHEKHLLKEHGSFLEKQNLQQKELSIKNVEDVEKELRHLQQENDLLKDHVSLLESRPTSIQEKDDLLTKINNMEKELNGLRHENDLLKDHVSSFESNSISTQENDLLTKLNMKENEVQHLNLENKKLNELYKNLKVDFQETENRWTQLKDAYLNDKNRMTFLEKVIEELKMNNDELSSSNVKLNEDLEKSSENVIALKTDNSACNERIADLMAIIENTREQFEKALNSNSVEYEHDKKLLIQQHEHEKSLLINCNNKLEENTSQLNKVTDQLNIVLKENDLLKCERLKLDECIGRNNEKIFELNNIINELHNQMSQITNELEILRKENSSLSDKVNKITLELEENKLLSERFLKQKQLLKIKIKALKESENNCLLLQQKIMSLTEQTQDFNKNPNDLEQNDNKISTILHYCDTELQTCYELLNIIYTKFNAQTQNINTLQSVLVRLASLFPIDCFDDVYLAKIIDTVANNNLNDNELQSCLKKIVMGSIKMFEYILHMKHVHKLSEAQSIARTEVDKLITEAIEKVKTSTENEHSRQNNELLSVIENLQSENYMLKLNIASNTQVHESKEVLTDLNGSTVTNLLSLDVESVKNENDTLKQFLKIINEKLGFDNFEETNNVALLNSLNELQLRINNIKNENLLLKSQHQKQLTLKPLEHPIEQQIDKHCNSQNAFIQPIEIAEENYGNAEKIKLTSENACVNQHDVEKSNPSVNGDSKMLLVRYKNLKSKFKEIRTKTVELENKVASLTKDLECANSKYKQLSDQYASCNETHEADIVNCQSEIENLMGEKLEAYRQLTVLKEKHLILQNDYDQLKSNLDDKISSNDIGSTNMSEQNTFLKGQLNDTQHLIDSAYSKVLCEWPPSDPNLDWVLAQSKKLDDIINAKCILPNSGKDDYGDSEAERLKSCVQIIHELVTSILTNSHDVEVSFTDELVDLMSKIKSYTETFLEFVSVKNSDLHLVNERHIELSHCSEGSDKNTFLSEQRLYADEPLITENSLPLAKDALKSSLSKNEGNGHFQQAIAERDRLIEFLSEKISKLDNLSRNVDNIILIRHKLDKALTAVHERDVRCDELTLELTRLLEERDMLQLKLSNAIRQIQFLSDHKPQQDTSNLSEETYGSKNIDDKLEELHSLEYRRDADLFTDQEQRHKSQMLLHQGHKDSSTTQESMPSNTNEEVSTSQSWFKDILSW